jgi:CRP/FNR family transcriptional regulator, cyclic AMP receptor protein
VTNRVDKSLAAKLEFLQSSPYFAGLDREALGWISGFIFERTALRGEIILLEGESSGRLFFVASGTVKVFKTSARGKEQILSILRPVESFNDTVVFDGKNDPASAEAMAESLVYNISEKDIKAVMQRYPLVTVNAGRVLAHRVRELLSLVEDLSFRPVIGRVARILLAYAGNGSDSQPYLTQREMAAMAGTVRELVGRSLKTMQEEGIISLERHRLSIIKRKDMEKIAEEIA